MDLRPDLHKLVDSLPDGAISAAKKTLELLQSWPPKIKALLRPVAGRPEGVVASTKNRTDKDGTHVIETDRVVGAHPFKVVERFRVADDGQKLVYSVEITGRNRQVRQEIEFESAAPGRPKRDADLVM